MIWGMPFCSPSICEPSFGYNYYGGMNSCFDYMCGPCCYDRCNCCYDPMASWYGGYAGSYVGSSVGTLVGGAIGFCAAGFLGGLAGSLVGNAIGSFVGWLTGSRMGHNHCYL